MKTIRSGNTIQETVRLSMVMRPMPRSRSGHKRLPASQKWHLAGVTFADVAGLKLKFMRPINDEDLEELARLFPESEGFQSGAEGYIIEQEPGRHLFQRVKEENLFHFWWD